jgi:hypothetical protein
MDFESLKPFLVGLFSRWIFKLAGGFLIGLGYTADSGMELTVGIITFVLGIIISLVQHNKAINTDPPK